MKDYILGFVTACALFLGYEVYETKRTNTPLPVDYTFVDDYGDYGAETEFSDFGYDSYVDVPDEIPT